MRFVTFAEADGDRAGVLDSGQVHALPPGVRLIDLIGGSRPTRRGRGPCPASPACRARPRIGPPARADPVPPSDLYRALADAVTFNGGPMQTAV